MSPDYFGALWRSAGMAPGGAGAPGPDAPTAAHADNASDPFDPFEAVEAPQGLAATAQGQSPARAMQPAPDGLTDRPPAITAAPQRLQPTLPPALAAAQPSQPHVQAALRWVAAGVTAPAPTRHRAPAGDPVPAGSTGQSSATGDVQRDTGEWHPPRDASPTTIEPLRTVLHDGPGPATPTPARTRADAPAASVEPAALPRPQPRAPATTVVTPRMGPQHTDRAAPGAGTEVHIGTLHVTLDAAATARFAARAQAASAPEAPRAPAARQEPRPGAGRTGTGSGLSRSRLPRW